MTSDKSMTMPPRWAESLLRMLLSSADRDSVSGDLLEEYRESVVPALGDRANGWYSARWLAMCSGRRRSGAGSWAPSS